MPKPIARTRAIAAPGIAAPSIATPRIAKFAALSLAMSLATFLALSFALPVPARAEIEYPWCAQYFERSGGGGTNCGFVTHAQCMATISGIGGTCYENPRYRGGSPHPKKRISPQR